MRLGQEWIRTTEGVKPADLQSAPFGRFGTYTDFPLRPALSGSANRVQNARFPGDGSKLYRALAKAVQADFTAEVEDIPSNSLVRATPKGSRRKFEEPSQKCSETDLEGAGPSSPRWAM